ncbi:MAG TPA: type II CAAX endopeptidase family protein [Bradyrhizobium sp.]|uniref:CPBP family intramembrane glutamic endopeptidase n=1 Tax=Bradyrhizobium sp. TaxID=376 RepID=UPI002D803C57|nr:type II CAAX endopeptidase family protein [Bradyrhizobium sp.]HET7887686.1 type II CAAX endopeptidase family protein [Bradyrhizobium sp.]
MDSLNPESQILIAPPETSSPRVWKFWGTAFWGFVVFAAMFVGQLAVVAWFLLQQSGPINRDTFGEAVTAVVSNGVTISLSVITGLPAVAVALWVAIRIKRASFADYLALRAFSWADLGIGVVALFVLVMGWDALSRATGREVEPGFMGDVLKTARADGALGLLVVAFCVAAPITEEFFARGFLYRGWSESFLRVPGAIVLSSLIWTGLHLQYNWYFLGEVFSIGVLLGYIRYRSKSTWLTIILHGLNNLGAVVQTIILTSS